MPQSVFSNGSVVGLPCRNDEQIAGEAPNSEIKSFHKIGLGG
jgi:hypothetical protein